MHRPIARLMHGAGMLSMLFGMGSVIPRPLFVVPRVETDRRRDRRTTHFDVNGARECARRVRQGADLLQKASHRPVMGCPPTVRPRHIFDTP
jgi:hypothetical protein